MRGEGLRTIETDLLVVGSGGAGLWAAIRAAEAGARTLLVDKGLVAQENNVVVEWVFHDKNTGSFMGALPTGKTVALPSVTLTYN
jgi:thioredoxin reductase